MLKVLDSFVLIKHKGFYEFNLGVRLEIRKKQSYCLEYNITIAAFFQFIIAGSAEYIEPIFCGIDDSRKNRKRIFSWRSMVTKL